MESVRRGDSVYLRLGPRQRDNLEWVAGKPLPEDAGDGVVGDLFLLNGSTLIVPLTNIAAVVEELRDAASIAYGEARNVDPDEQDATADARSLDALADRLERQADR